MYDLAIGDSVAADTGPWFGDCRTPEAACDRSVNLTPEGAQDGLYPENIVINSAPVTAVCPGTVDPNETAACDGEPPYFVAATVGLPGDYSAPDLLQFNSWESAFTSCWIGDLEDAAECSVEEPGPGTALSYYYGLSPLSAVVLGPGERRQFTQFFAMSQTGCPSVIRDGLDPSLDSYRGPY